MIFAVWSASGKVWIETWLIDAKQEFIQCYQFVSHVYFDMSNFNLHFILKGKELCSCPRNQIQSSPPNISHIIKFAFNNK